MLQRELLEKSGEPGFTIGQKEKDYVQHWALSYLGRQGFLGVFKGGTALQKAYHLPRYSEDLDFTLNGTALPDFETLSRYLESAGFGRPEWKKERKKGSINIRLRLQGPLYNGKAISECTVRFDFSERENAILPVDYVAIHPSYPDLMPYSVRVMNKNEIAAEKISALMTRQSARDLYDLSFLLRQGMAPGFELVHRKLSFYEVEFSFDSFAKRVEKLSKIWKVEMSAFVSQVPDFQQVKEEVLDEIERKMKNYL